MKIAHVIGARPQFIKLAPLSTELKKHFDEVIIHTGQHYDYEMNEIFFEQLGIPKPDYNLGVGSGSHAHQTGEMLKGIENVIKKEGPDLVLIYGDTNSTIAGAVATTKLNIEVGHIEAGLRSFNRDMPEEINRVLTDHASDLLFAPTENAMENLDNEGLEDKSYLVGDVMYDALLNNIEIAEEKSNILEELGVGRKDYYLITIHRASNTDQKENLKNIIKAILESGKKFIFPAHPRVKKNLKKQGLVESIERSDNIKIIDPVGYLDFIMLEKNSKKILTDSGGIQKEAYFLDKQCITLRNETEWIETLKGRWNILVGSDKERIKQEIDRKNKDRKKTGFNYGDGKASKEILDKILKQLN